MYALVTTDIEYNLMVGKLDLIKLGVLPHNYPNAAPFAPTANKITTTVTAAPTAQATPEAQLTPATQPTLTAQPVPTTPPVPTVQPAPTVQPTPATQPTPTALLAKIQALIKEYSPVFDVRQGLKAMKGEPMSLSIREDIRVTPFRALNARQTPLH